jgi:prepilin-type N-terminal cleavage/methylation domain-containing protein
MHTAPSQQYKRASKGFTLVETLVAITVLLLAVAAPLTLGMQGLRASRVARDQVVATYLMQEAIEYIRFTRDSNRIGGGSWLSGLDTCLAGACTINPWTLTLAACSGGTCPAISYDAATGRYGYTTGWAATKFVRTITMQETVPGAEAQLTVSVSWPDGTVNRSVSLTEDILNWQ